MHKIRLAVENDAKNILEITKRAFTLYRDELHSSAPVKALSETADTVKDDIINHTVYVAEEDGKIIGAIRCKFLNHELAYVYRFGVDPEITKTGVGSDLLKTVIELCEHKGCKAIALHTNSRYYQLARYYYGKQFYVHSTSTAKGYIRALFIKELTAEEYDISPAFEL